MSNWFMAKLFIVMYIPIQTPEIFSVCTENTQRFTICLSGSTSRGFSRSDSQGVENVALEMSNTWDFLHSEFTFSTFVWLIYSLVLENAYSFM